MQNSFAGASMGSTTSTPSPPSPVQKKRRQQATTDLSNVEVVVLSPDTITGKNKFTCEICNKGFKREQNLQLHGRVHNLPWELTKKQNKSNSSQTEKEKVYVCPVSTCARNDPHTPLSDLGGLKKHYSRKHCDKKMKCEKCNKSYAVEADLKAHQKACSHDKYKCDCGSSFSRCSTLRTHKMLCNLTTHGSTQTPATQSSFPVGQTTSRNLSGPSTVGVPGFYHPNSTPALSTTTNFHGYSSIHALPHSYSGSDHFDHISMGSVFRSNVSGNLPYTTNSAAQHFPKYNLHFSSSMQVDGMNYTSSVHAPSGSYKNAMPPFDSNILMGHYSGDQVGYKKFDCVNGTNNNFTNLLGNSTKFTVSQSEDNIFDINNLYDKVFGTPNPKPPQNVPQEGFVSGNSNISDYGTGNFGYSTAGNSRDPPIGTNNFSGIMDSNFDSAANQPQQGCISTEFSTLGNFENSTAMDFGVGNSYIPTFGNAAGLYEPQTNYLAHYGNTISGNVVTNRNQLGGEAVEFANGHFSGKEQQLDWSNNVVGGDDFQPLQVYFGAPGNRMNGEESNTNQHFGGSGKFSK